MILLDCSNHTKQFIKIKFCLKFYRACALIKRYTNLESVYYIFLTNLETSVKFDLSLRLSGGQSIILSNNMFV